MLTDKLYTNYFFMKIDLKRLEHQKCGEFLVFKVIFLSQKFVHFFFIEEYKIRRRTFISDNF
jgi:hypothetical protein